MNNKFFLFIIASLISLSSSAQDYIDYQKKFNQIDLYVQQNELSKASVLLDTIDGDYKFVFAKHCMMGLQICCKNEDSIRAKRWLTRCFLSGIPGWIIRQNVISEKTLHYTNTKQVWLHYDSLRSFYKNAVDTVLRNRINVLMNKDMVYTNKVNKGSMVMYPVHGLQWIHNNAVVHKELKKIIEAYGFPGERLIGLDPQLEDSLVYGKIIRSSGLANTLTEGQAFFMLLHYFSTPRDQINPLLFPNIKTGLIPVENYARINDYHYAESKHRKRDPRFYVINGEVQENIDDVNIRRAKIGLMSYGQQQQNKKLYLLRLKSSTLNKEIIYE